MGWQLLLARTWSKGSFLLEGRDLIWQAGRIGYTSDIDGWTSGNKGLVHGRRRREGIHDGSVFLSLVSVALGLI